MQAPLKFNYYYSSSMVMKLGMAFPDKKIRKKQGAFNL